MVTTENLPKGEKGSVLALITISMVVIVSFAAGVMDIGMMYETRRQLQNAADAAALAGATEMARGSTQAVAINAALDVAQRNGVSPSEIDAGYPLITNEGPYVDNSVVVAANRRLNLVVAGLFNNGVSRVQAQATAVVGPVLPTDDLWPWGVPRSEAVTGRRIPLKVGSPPPSPGNFRALAFPPDRGANAYRDNIMFGYGQDPGDYISPILPWDILTEPGNMVGPTRQGVNYVLGMASSSGQDDPSGGWNQPEDTCTWPGAPKATSDPDNFPLAGWVGHASICYRIGIVPLLQSFDVNGRSEVTVVDWGAFYLIGLAGNGGKTTVEGYFLERAMVSGGRTNWGAPMSGLIGVRLWR